MAGNVVSEVLYNRLAKLGLDDSKSTEENVKVIKEVTEFLENDDNPDQAVKKIVDCGVIKNLTSALCSGNNDVHEHTAKLLAEIAKQEEARSVCIECGVVPPLLRCIQGDSIPVTTQSCRALGNICFDNDEARTAVDEEGGVEIICEALRKHVAAPGEHGRTLRRVLCGVLLNLTNSTETLQDKAVACGALEVLNTYLQQCTDDERTLQMALLSLNCLIDSEQAEAALGGSTVAVSVVQLLAADGAHDIIDTVFEVLNNLAENDAVKLQLSADSVVERLLAVIASHQQNTTDEDSLSVVKNASDLLNTLLTGDDSMEMLYSTGEGKLFKTVVDWLESHHMTLQAAGALAIGNFARKDTHCIDLVKRGVHSRLLKCIDTEAGESSPNLQHAVFSALRNLAIPPENKRILVEGGVLKKILPFEQSAEFTPVVFKILATLRMLVDGQESAAARLGSDQQFLVKLVSWTSNEEHAGVKGESRRLIAFLIRHAGRSDVMETIATAGGIEPLCNMMHCEHALMQSEAIVALTLIASTVLDKTTEAFISGEVVPAIKVVLTDSDTLAEILCNAASLVIAIAKSGELKELLQLADIHELFQSLQSHEETQVADQAKKVCALLKPAS